MSFTVSQSRSTPASPRGSRPLFERSLNGTGFTINALDEVSREFANFAAEVAPETVVDVGAGFGVATLAALDAGASVIANDVDHGHLDQITVRCSAAARSRLSINSGRFPADVDLKPRSAAAVLLSRVLHFFDGPDVEQSASTVAGWLRPGGKVYVVCESSLFLDDPRLRNVYQRQLAQKERWPGFVRGVHALLPDRAQYVPDQLHYLDAATLSDVFQAQGFEIEAAGLFRRHVPAPGSQRTRSCVKLIATKQ